MRTYIFSVTIEHGNGDFVKRNECIKTKNSEEEARRTIIHKVLKEGGSVLKIEEPEETYWPDI